MSNAKALRSVARGEADLTSLSETTATRQTATCRTNTGVRIITVYSIIRRVKANSLLFSITNSLTLKGKCRDSTDTDSLF